MEQWISAQDQASEAADLSDLVAVNTELARLRVKLTHTRRLMSKTGRARVDAEVMYDRALNRKMLTVDGRTVAERQAYAEIACEALENEKLVAKALHEEAISMHRTVRDELDAVEQISNNLRAEMNLAR